MKTKFQIGNVQIDISGFIEACNAIPDNLDKSMKEKLRKRNNENLEFMQRNLTKIEALLKKKNEE